MAKWEGKSLRLYRVRQVNLRLGIDSPAIDKALHGAYKRFSSNNRANKANGSTTILNKKLLTRLHMRVTEADDTLDIYRGRFRSDLITPAARQQKRNDYKAGQIPTSEVTPNTVERQMEKWFKEYGDANKEFDPIEAYREFLRISPFMVANDRMAWLILWWLQMNKGQRFIDKLEDLE